MLWTWTIVVNRQSGPNQRPIALGVRIVDLAHDDAILANHDTVYGH